MPPAPRAHRAPPSSARLPVRWCLAVARALVGRPSLWPVALRQVRRLAAPGWWRHRPFLPVPPAGYLAFRALTMYGDAAQLPATADVLTYLAWCRTFPTSSPRIPAVAGRAHK